MMDPLDFDLIIAEISQGVEGDAFWVNIWLNGGALLKDYAVHARPEGAGYVQLSQDDRPPIFVAISAIAAIELRS